MGDKEGEFAMFDGGQLVLYKTTNFIKPIDGKTSYFEAIWSTSANTFVEDKEILDKKKEEEYRNSV